MKRQRYWYQIAFPNPLCFLFEIQRPSWIWESEILGELLYKIHLWTCPDILRENIELLKKKIKGSI